MSFGEHGGFVRGLDAWIQREDDDQPRLRRVERTCCDCREQFLMVVDGEYQMHVQCPRCEQRSRVSAEEAWERR